MYSVKRDHQGNGAHDSFEYFYGEMPEEEFHDMMCNSDLYFSQIDCSVNSSDNWQSRMHGGVSVDRCQISTSVDMLVSEDGSSSSIRNGQTSTSKPCSDTVLSPSVQLEYYQGTDSDDDIYYDAVESESDIMDSPELTQGRGSCLSDLSTKSGSTCGSNKSADYHVMLSNSVVMSAWTLKSMDTGESQGSCGDLGIGKAITKLLMVPEKNHEPVSEVQLDSSDVVSDVYQSLKIGDVGESYKCEAVQLDDKIESDVVSEDSCLLAEEMVSPSVWSILTTQMDYLAPVDGQCLYTIKSSVQDSAKHKHFDAANNNRPNVYVPTLHTAYNEGSYGTIDIRLTSVFDPNRNICATYLWSDVSLSGPMFSKAWSLVDGEELWFLQGRFPISQSGEVSAKLTDDTVMNVLIDTGCSKPIVNSRFVANTPLLQKSRKHWIDPVDVVVANDERIRVDHCIAVIMNIQGHWFEFISYVAPISADVDFVIGQKAMYELEATADWRSLMFTFLAKSVPIEVKETIVLEPGEEKELVLKLIDSPTGKGRVPIEEPDTPADAVVRVQSCRDRVEYPILTTIRNGVLRLQIKNDLGRCLRFELNERIGSVDMRSLGFFHISRANLESLLKHEFKDKLHLMSEEDTSKYFKMWNEDHDQLVQAAVTTQRRVEGNTHLKQRKDALTDELIEHDNDDQYPWLAADDERRKLSDEEIIYRYIDLSDSDLTEDEKIEVRETLLKYKEAFSLRDEIGRCPHMEVELELHDKSPFFIRPFPIKESDKEIVDREMRRGVLLGILKKGLTSYSSPIMLIPRKKGGVTIPRIVTDFRHLNTRLVTIQPSIPLVRDAIQILGSAECEVMSLSDLRDAYHTLRLSKESQKFCGITPYYGSDTYLYQRLGMGLSVSPAIWQNFIQTVLSNIRKNHFAIMDDCLTHSTKKSHLGHLIDLFEALIEYGLKISPKKCKLFKTELVFMGLSMKIVEGVPRVEALKSRIEAISKLEAPKTVKDCRQFCGMVNYMSMFLPSLQTKLIPIYFLTRKGVPFVWEDQQQEAWESIKQDVTKAPMLTMPNAYGHFVLITDTSKLGCGGALWQEHTRPPIKKPGYYLVGYYSKKLPEAVQRYSISELELTGMMCNVAAFKHLLRNANFTIYCDHSALVHIVKAKREPPTTRIKKLLEHLSEYKFDLRFLAGKSKPMTIADLLSRHPDNDKDDPHQIIPIAFLCRILLKDQVDNDDRCRVMTRSMAKSKQVDVPGLYPMTGNKNISPLPTQTVAADKGCSGGATEVASVVGGDISHSHNNLSSRLPMSMRTPHHNPTGHQRKVEKSTMPLELYENIVKPVAVDVTLKGKLPSCDIDQIITNYPFKMDIPSIEELSQRKEKLLTEIPDSSIFRKHIPKQVEINKFLEVLKQKVIHNYKLPISAIALRQEYRNSPYFRDILKYITTGYCGLSGKAEKMFKTMCQDYVVMSGILFKIRYEDKKMYQPGLVLCVPEKYIPLILYQYHAPLISGHPGVLKMYLAVSKRYYFPAMLSLIRQFVETCLECQSMKPKTPGPQVYYPRIPLDTRVMKRVSVDIKDMPVSSMGYRCMLVCTCEATNWVKAIPLANQQASTIADALFYRIVCEYGAPQVIICDEGPSFTSQIMKEYLHSLNITPYYISPANHGSNRTERYIRTLNDILCKNLYGAGDKWPLYVIPSVWAMNTQVSQVTGYSPYEMVFHTPAPDQLHFEFDPNKTGLKVSTFTYLQVMKEKAEMIAKLIKERRTYEKESLLVKEMRKFPDFETLAIGDLVMVDHNYGSTLQSQNKKLKRNWIGPVKVQAVLDETHYVCTDWLGKLIPKIFHIHRLKRYKLNTGELDEKGIFKVIENSDELYKYWETLKESKGT